jgi:hypothetical protein
MKQVLLTLLMLGVFPAFANAEEFNAGIVQGLWYDQETVFAGEPVRIYVAIRNNTGSDLSGTVEFFDGEKKIERKNVQALNGRIIESWADWTPSYGDHTLRATLSRIELHQVGTTTQEVEVTSALAEDTLFVDRDTDDDGRGDQTDPDDDNDGVSDAEEKERGTDPLVKQVSSPQEKEEDDETKPKPADDDTSDTSKDPASPEGLERYFTDSPAEEILSGATTLINEAKEDLDSYRAKRKEEQAGKEETAATPYTDGFGTVERKEASEGSGIRDLSLSDFFASVWNLAKTIFNVVYTFVLTLLSFVLGHPTLVQVGVLLLILFFLMKFAAKFGRRPRMKKI